MNTNERKSLFSSFMEVLEAKEKRVQAERQLEEENYQRRTQRIYDFHERQRREAVELRRCLEYVSQHAHVLETVLRGSGVGGGGEGVPLGAALLRQAAAMQSCMVQCVANAARIRQLLTAAHRPQMDTVLAKMEAELSTWSAFLQRAVDAAYSSEVLVDNLHNMIAEQRRCVRELSASSVLASLCACAPDGDASGASAGASGAPPSPSLPRARRSAAAAAAAAAASSTPIPRD